MGFVEKGAFKNARATSLFEVGHIYHAMFFGWAQKVFLKLLKGCELNTSNNVVAML